MFVFLFQKKAVGGKFILNGLCFTVTAFFVLFCFQVGLVRAAVNDYQGQIFKDTKFLSLKSGYTTTYNLKIKNTGKATWSKSKVFLETGPMLKYISQVRHSGWLAVYRPIGLSKDVKPGETTTISFKMQGPAGVNGTIQENFLLVNNNQPIAGTLTRFFIDITGGQIAKQVTLPVVSTNNVTTLSTVSFSNINITTTTTTNDVIKKTADFCIALTAEKKEEYVECQTNNNEIDSSSGVVKYQKALSKEPIIRVGLYSTTGAERITCDKIYDIYAGNEIIFSGLAPKYVATVSFDFTSMQYAVSTPGMTKFTKNKIRLVPREVSGVMTMVDYKNSPKWNTKYNDNLFRNIIEFRYSENTKRFWIINELPINNYLKGLAETTDYSPLDFQKVLITAARTYVLYHYARGLDNGLTEASTKHASEYFHVDATYDQVYKGYGSEIRMPKLAQAVSETNGLIVTYDNKLAITPYFSNSDGRTRSWTEVWGGEAKSWLVSILVPEDNNQTLWGHGVGLSARGALIMIRDKGKSWQETLKYFYTGTQLQKMY